MNKGFLAPLTLYSRVFNRRDTLNSLKISKFEAYLLSRILLALACE